MVRDRRLLIAMLLFGGSLIAWLVQAAIVSAYINSLAMEDWQGFAKIFAVEPPLRPQEYGDWACLDMACVPALPFMAGWIGIAAFLGGWFILAHAWWKPKAFTDPA